MMRRVLIAAVVSIGALSACSPAPGADGPRATVKLKDGSTVSGSVTSSSATEIQIASDDKSTRTIPMSQVRSVEYEDAAPAASTSSPASTSSTSSTGAKPAKAA